LSNTKMKGLLLLFIMGLVVPTLFKTPVAQEVRHPVVFVYSMEANFQPEGHFNPWSDTGFIWHAGVNMFSQLAPHVLGTTEYYPELATSWNYDGDWLVVNLRSDVTWHDGEKFTSKDVWSTFTIRRLKGYSEWSSHVIDDVQIVNDTAIEFHVIALKDLALNYILSAYLYGPYHIYKEFVDDYLANPENVDTIAVELNMFNPKTVNEGAVGTGPFMLVNMTESDMWLKKYDGFYAADNIVIDLIHGIKEPSNEVGWGYFFSNVGDWGEPFSPVSVADALTANGVKVMYAKQTRHDFIVFNNKRPLLANKLFRQAVAYAFNRTEIVLAANYPVFHASKYVIPFSGMYITNWVDESFLEGLNRYETNIDKAKEIFAQLGLKYNEKGQLTYPNGTVITFYAKFPAPWTDVALMMQNFATQMNRVGITVIPLALDWATVSTSEINGDFDIVWDNMGGDHPFIQGFDTSSSALSSGFPSYAGFPKVVEYKEQQVNLTKLFVDWGKAKSLEDQKVFVKQLAEVYNDQVFAIPFADVDTQFYGSNRFIYPPSYDTAWMCNDYARGVVVAQLFFPGKFALNMSYWAKPVEKPPETPVMTYVAAGLAVLVLALTAALFLMRRK